mgnify:FL=1
MAHRVTSITERECEHVDYLDTTFPGVIKTTSPLIAEAMRQAVNVVGTSDTTLAAELLLLAGMSLMLAANDKRMTSTCVHFENLKSGGEALPLQSVFVCLNSGREAVAKPKASPIRTVTTTSGDSEVPADEVHEVPQEAVSSMYESLPIDGSEEYKQAVEEFERDQARFADQPTMKDLGVKLPKRRIKSKPVIPQRAPGKDGLSFKRDM